MIIFNLFTFVLDMIGIKIPIKYTDASKNDNTSTRGHQTSALKIPLFLAVKK